MPDPSSDLVALNEDCRLLRVSVDHLAAKRGSAYSAEEASVSVSPKFVLGTDVLGESGEFTVGLQVTIDSDAAEVSAAVTGLYLTSLQSDRVTEDLVLEYANHVAVMGLFPFLRQHVADLTQRVFDAPLLLPILQRGELWFTQRVGDEDADGGPQIG